MRSLNEALEIEEADEHEFLDVGPRKLTPFEAMRLEEDPCRPIYMSYETECKLHKTYIHWLSGVWGRSRALPATYDRQFVRSEGSK